METKRHTPYGASYRAYMKKLAPWLRSESQTRPAFNREKYQTRIASAFARHLAKGGSIVEHGQFGPFATFKLGTNCFTEPTKSNPQYIGHHCAARFLSFGFPVSLS